VPSAEAAATRIEEVEMSRIERHLGEIARAKAGITADFGNDDGA
jgi:hypothetical protein